MKTGYCLTLTYLFVVVRIVVPAASFAREQDPFIITQSEPENGATSVPATFAVTFTFSEPFDATARYSSGVPVGILDPNGTISPRIAGYSVSPDQLTLTLEISNPEDADLALVITGAKRHDGQRLCTPFAFNYTTKSSLGSTAVSGTVGWIMTKGHGGCNIGPGVIATLFDAPIDQGGEILYSGVSVGNEYVVTNVRPGTYWPYYFFDMNGNGEIEPVFFPNNAWGIEVSFYDGDDDGLIDVISTESGDVSGVNPYLLSALPVEDETSLFYVSLEAAYPNPFNPTTTITYTIPRPSDVRLEVFDLLGKRVRLLEAGFKPSGEHDVILDAPGFPSGIYFYTLTTRDFSQTKKIVLLR